VLISSITPLIESYGLVFVAVLICLESIALPVPGETVLILAAVFAGTRHQLHIIAIVLTAAAAAFVGQLIGYMIAIVVGVVAVTAIVVGVNFLRRHEERLIAEAELALPGRLKSP
jgi:membrane protein DedA with SNARE-associated domain